MAIYSELNRDTFEGDVVGPASSTDGDIAIFDGTTGKLLQDGGVGLPQNDGELIIGDTAGDAQINTITGGTGITVTNGAGSITIDADNNGDVTSSANLTDDAVVVGDGGAKGVKTLASLGTSGQVLTSNGAGTPPSFQDASGSVSGPVSSTDNALSRWDGVNGDTLQDSTVIVSDNGEMTNASQPAFLAYNSADDTNQTGNGATVEVPFDTVVFDRGSNFSSNTFTAPVTGLYVFNVCVRFEQLTAAMTNLNLILETGNRNYQFDGNPGVSKSSVDQYTANFSVLTDMDATDTARITAAISGGAGNTAGISGASTLVTYFSGHLVA